MSGKNKSYSLETGIFDIISYSSLILFTAICIYPFYYIIIYSISNPVQAARGIFLFPAGLDLTTYINIFARGDLGNAFLVSIARTVVGTFICVLATSLFAFLITKEEMLFRKFIYRFVIITMYINAGLIPWYITMKTYGLKDNFLLYIMPGAVNAFFLVLVKTFIEQLPPSLEESASLDGAGFFTIFFRIIFPLSKPIIATIAVYAAVGNWNAWIDNYFLVRKSGLQTVQLVLYNYLNEALALAKSMQRSSVAGTFTKPDITPESVRMAITTITVAPIMAVYPFLQKYFIKGILMGAVKG